MTSIDVTWSAATDDQTAAALLECRAYASASVAVSNDNVRLQLGAGARYHSGRSQNGALPKTAQIGYGGD